ncbi:NAP-domain-containing protein [Tilletiaria anomala UBC 951]|uniref:NAP-domain-containing protein n=1 Tax=Tilletiaria anomala (strain ATCC 24038 / CBS 436.72 / UBC 951) TaxID=1037660 RepID=A0A066W7J8_TILAU|nr:NAP-domain-containing protein [Tilletiaria anomala UBC 951]KDN48513.1 NAP-domain-containing protein [Tilletiaria anomala UBC 951]
MSSNVEIGKSRNADLTAPTPQNTPLNTAPLTRETLSRPTVGTISEDKEADDHAGAAASVLAANPALAGLIQSKLNTLVGRSSGYVELLPDYVKRRVEGLKGLQVEHQKIEADFQKEILQLEKKYAARYAPLYEKRASIIAGKQEPTTEEVKAGEASEADDEEAEDEDEEEGVEGQEAPKKSLVDVPAPADGQKGIPEFWLTALRNHVALNELITDRDEEALKALDDIKMIHLPDGQSGFKLEFHFDPSRNDFFSDEVLTKTYFYQDEVGYSGDLVYDHADGCTIHWKEDKDLTHKIETKKQRNKNTNQTRTVKRSVPVESFFNFFSPPKPPSAHDGGELDVEDEAEIDELEERLELDYQIGEDLKDRIIPHAIDFFTGKALQYEDMEGLDDDFEDEDEDEDDDDDEDQDHTTRRLGASAGSQMAGSADAEQCRQQ